MNTQKLKEWAVFGLKVIIITTVFQFILNRYFPGISKALTSIALGEVPNNQS
jgi:hypothetical protein